MTRDTDHARVNRYLLRRRNGAHVSAVADAVMLLDDAARVERVLSSLVTQGLAIARKDGKQLRYFHATRAPIDFRKRAPAKADKPAPVPAPVAIPAPVRSPRPKVEVPKPNLLTPQVPPKQVRKLRPRADMPQPVALNPSDRIAAEVADFLARGGKIQQLASGVVSQPLRKIGTAECPVVPVSAGRRVREGY